ncbi:MAG: esterase, partial [Halobacteria archaeon]|nr:esterase [Halobacteria archaeon]
MIIYLHGFNSTGNSAKGQFLKHHLPDIPVLTPTYHHDPKTAIAFLERFVEENLQQNQHLMLIGSSLGGYYAQYLAHQFNLKTVLINPALMPLATLHDYLGENTNFYTGETYVLTQAHLDALLALDIPEPCMIPVATLVLLYKGDEVLYYRVAASRYAECGEVILFEDGDHQFQHLPE